LSLRLKTLTESQATPQFMRASNVLKTLSAVLCNNQGTVNSKI